MIVETIQLSANKRLLFNQNNYLKSYKVIKVVFLCRGWPEGSLFNSYYTKVWGRVLLLSQDCSTLPLICALQCWVLSKEVSSTIFKIFGMTQPRIEPRSPGPLANTLHNRSMSLAFKVSNRSRDRPEGSFSVATTLRCGGVGCSSFPRIASVYPWYVPYNEC